MSSQEMEWGGGEDTFSAGGKRGRVKRNLCGGCYGRPHKSGPLRLLPILSPRHLANTRFAA